jgi:hypothetical protein
MQTSKAIGVFVLGVATSATGYAGVEDADYDGDGRADRAVYHAAAGNWYVLQSARSQLKARNWGWNQSQPVPGDFDGDRRADFCVYDGHRGRWYLLRSSDGVSSAVGWGSEQQECVAGDFDGDRRNDYATFHPPSGYWFVLNSGDGNPGGVNWGWKEAEPVPGDYDGDGRTDRAVYHRAGGNWYILQSAGGRSRIANWGWSETEPVQADYDGDGKTDLAVFHPKSGDWFIQKSSTGQLWLHRSGWAECQPVPADYDGDGKADPAAYRISRGDWHWTASTDGRTRAQNWGWKDAEPAASAYRVDDDAIYYGHQFVHDYDEDAFAATDNYPRTGQRPASAPAASSVSVGALQPSQVQWLTSRGQDYSRARTVMTLSNVSIQGSRCYFKTSPAIPWPVRGSKNINAVGFLIRRINGKYIGGKCEWVVGSRGWYDCRTNVADGYNGHTMPASGERVWVGLGHPDNGSEVSQLVETRWP